jgi:VanZ family protein
VTGGYAVFIAVLAVLPPASEVSVGQLDRLAHLCEYALFAWCLRRAARASAFSRSSGLLLALGCSIAYGALLEGVQGLLGYRTAEWGDVAANTLGAFLGNGMSRHETTT